ncbi:MAG: tRNA (adenosine(37)-N6)-dimethylallyltransferase MiaA, partial [Burkholderiaceae bacterium]
MILGPTASGKSAAAMAVAQHLPVEIISMDSAQVYRGMDIGTAKPSASERSAVPHHLIDIIDPAQAYSAARFVTDADRLIEQIRQRNKTPLLVGGTMLYARALTEGLNNLPRANPDLRARLDNEARQEGWPAMHQKLARVDARTAARLKPTDSQRIQRALEVHALTGSPMSALLDAAPEHKS